MNDKDLIDNVLTALDLGALRPGGISAQLCIRLADVVRQGQAEQAVVSCTPTGFVWTTPGYATPGAVSVLYIGRTGTCSARPPQERSQWERIDSDDDWQEGEERQ